MLIKRVATLCMLNFMLITVLSLSACTGLQQNIQNPSLKLTSLKLLPAAGFQQQVELGLAVSNPNAMDLTVRGMSYSVSLADFKLLSGVSNQIPTLKAYQETPLTLVVSTNIIEMLRFIDKMTKAPSDNIPYKLQATLDFSAWLPAITLEEAGRIPLTQ